MMKRPKIRLRLTASCWMVGAVLAAMWLAAVNYDNSLAYVVLFSVVSLILVSALQAQVNISRLQVRLGRVAPVFVGGEVLIPYTIHNEAGLAKAEVRLLWLDCRGESGESTVTQIPAQGQEEGYLRLSTWRRGCHRLEQLEVYTLYPLGIFRVGWTEKVEVTWWEYPEPKGILPWPEVIPDQRQQDDGQFRGGDDFGGVRAYVMGESQRHIDWKAVARGRPLLVKEFIGSGTGRVWFSWSDLPGMETETRLSQLTKWVVEAEHRGCVYGLRWPGQTVPVGTGPEHYHRCLRRLAEWGSKE